MVWFRRAAEQGHANARNYLGVMYMRGEGVDKNHAWAVYWLALAAQQGDDLAPGNIQENLKHLTAFRVARPTINVRAKPTTDAEVLLTIPNGTMVYSLANQNGWREVYIPQGHTVGFVFAPLLTAANAPASRQMPAGSGNFPAPPQSREGYVTCNTRCNNADCYRTYSDGRQVRFQARQVWDAFNNTFKYDSGGC